MTAEDGGAAEAAEEHRVDSPGAVITTPAQRRIITTALLLGMAVAALEQTVVSTAMPTIIASLRGLDIYPWVISAYLLAATVTTPLYGKLADLFGRKKVLLFGIGLFCLGSILSGCAQSMRWLIAMRVVQGLGAGALGPIILTMIGDLYSLKERAKVQGLFSGVWGASSLIGPAIGGELTVRLSWRAVFFVTVPFGVFSAWVLMRHVHEKLEHKKGTPIDWLGAGLLAGGSTALLLAVLGGSGGAGSIDASLLAVAGALFVALVAHERHAADPVLPIDLLMRPTIAAAIVGSFLLGTLIFGLDTYVPLYVQGVLGGEATNAGRIITPLFLMWSISVAIAAKVLVRLGFRVTAVVGSVLITLGALCLAWGSVHREWALAAFVVGLVFTGLGMGPTSLCYIVGVQNVVPWERRGVATGAVVFFRSLGGAIGVGALGAALGFELSRQLIRQGVPGVDATAALRPETHALLRPDQLQAVQFALQRGLFVVYLQMVAVAVLCIICSAGLAGGRADHAPAKAPEQPEDDLSLALAEH